MGTVVIQHDSKGFYHYHHKIRMGSVVLVDYSSSEHYTSGFYHYSVWVGSMVIQHDTQANN
jgi:hypothetical protein